MKNIGLIGCGNIAETYFRSQKYFNNIKFVACADKYPEAAKKCADQYTIKSLNVDEVMLIALTAAATFSILDTYVPSMAVSARSGAGFGIGANLVGFPQ